MILEDKEVEVDDVADDAPDEELVEKTPKKAKAKEEAKAKELVAVYTGNKNMSINFHGEKHHIKKGEPVEGISDAATNELLKAGIIY